MWPARQPDTKQKKNDCQELAAGAKSLAENTLAPVLKATNDPRSAVDTFMSSLARTYTEFPSANPIEIFAVNQGRLPAQASSSFRDSGFAPGFRDGSNQVRHAAGGLLAGYNLGAQAGLSYINSRENPNDPANMPDIRLNGQTVPKGAELAGPRGYAAAAQLGEWVNGTLCGK